MHWESLLLPNYTHAWELLENRYHNNRLLIHNHVKSLFAAQSINKESPSLIRDLIDVTLRNLRALKTLEEPTDTWGYVNNLHCSIKARFFHRA